MTIMRYIMQIKKAWLCIRLYCKKGEVSKNCFDQSISKNEKLDFTKPIECNWLYKLKH